MSLVHKTQWGSYPRWRLVTAPPVLRQVSAALRYKWLCDLRSTHRLLGGGGAEIRSSMDRPAFGGEPPRQRVVLFGRFRPNLPVCVDDLTCGQDTRILIDGPQLERLAITD